MSRCRSCGSTSLERDPYSEALACSDCGSILEHHTYDAQINGFNGPGGSYSQSGTFVRIGTSGTGGSLAYKEKKEYNAQNVINELMFKLGVPSLSQIDVKDMIFTITEGEYGQGGWFSVLIGACACVVARKGNKSLPLAEAAAVVGCGEHELGRMVNRVIDFLDLRKESEFPVYNIVTAFERAVREFSAFSRLSAELIDRLRKQGLFLIQCSVKWCLTTGRRPLPVVVAVLVFVAELNAIPVKIKDVAMEFHSKVHTSKKRYKELLEALVEASQVLPWGKDVTVKNMVKNAPFVIQYMEKKSMLKRKNVESQGMNDLEDIVNECLRGDIVYELCDSSVKNDSLYYDTNERSRRAGALVHTKDTTVSIECLSLLYTKFLDETKNVKTIEDRPNYLDRGHTGMDLYACEDWWKGKSDLSRKLLMQEILDKDVGMDPMPPSFIKGCLDNQRRREKISVAKQRISRIIYPKDNAASAVGAGGEMTSPKKRNEVGEDAASDETTMKAAAKKKRRKKGADIDWEDFIIETLLLHQVKEEEIVKGHYNTLMGLYVFNSGIL